MSEKTFLQELQQIKAGLECIQGYREDTNSVNDDFDEDDELQRIIGYVDRMINQCLEIQLAMMKQGKMLDAKGR